MGSPSQNYRASPAVWDHTAMDLVTTLSEKSVTPSRFYSTFTEVPIHLKTCFQSISPNVDPLMS